MLQTGNGEYRALIPPLAGGSAVAYYISAVDKFGNAGREPTIGEFLIEVVENPVLSPGTLTALALLMAVAIPLALGLLLFPRIRKGRSG